MACLYSCASEYVVRRDDGMYASGGRGWTPLPMRAFVFRSRDG
jgi:hypothetical protein